MEIITQVKYYNQDKNGNRVHMSGFHNSVLHTFLRVEDFEEIYQSSLVKIWNTG